MRQILLRGAPGSGKSTLASLIRTRFPHVPILSSGTLLRAHLSNNDSGMGKGHLADSDLVIKLMHAEILKLGDSPTPVLIDGFPRKLDELERWRHLTCIPFAVVYCNCDVEVTVKKLINRRMCASCGKNYNLYKDHFIHAIVPKNKGRCDDCGNELIQRSDDQEEVIRNRLRIFSEEEDGIQRYLLKNVEMDRIVQVDSTRGKAGLEQAASRISNFIIT